MVPVRPQHSLTPVQTVMTYSEEGQEEVREQSRNGQRGCDLGSVNSQESDGKTVRRGAAGTSRWLGDVSAMSMAASSSAMASVSS